MTTAIETATDPAATAPTTPEYLRRSLIANVVIQAVLFLFFASLATSRAESHVLSAGVLAGIASAAAAGSALVAWVTNLYGGANDARTGAVVRTDDDPVATTDPFTARALWGNATLWALGAAAWAAAGAGIVAVALDGRVARFTTVFVVLLGLAGVSTWAIGSAARRRGVASVDSPATTVSGVRARGWRAIALPFAVSQGLLNAGVAWMLFHAYPTGNAELPGVLTDSTALADALLVVIPLTAIFGGIALSMGAFDRATGRVVLDDPDTQTVPRRSPMGPQVLVYAGIVGFVAFKLAGFVLSATPSLTAVIVTRGVLATVLVGLACGFGYVRGACNEVSE